MRRALALVCGISLVAASSGLAGAHHVGVFVPKDTDVTLNFKQIKAAGQAGRFDVALKLFDDGILHDTMEKYEKNLPSGLEDGLRAALKAKDLPGVELRLSTFLAFLTRERIRDAATRLRDADITPAERREQARKIVNAAWRYYNLADFVISKQEPKAAVALRMAFEDAQTFLGSMLVDPMWAAASNPCRPSAAKDPAGTNAGPRGSDEKKALATLALMERGLGEVIQQGALVAQRGGAKVFLPRW